MSGKLDKKNVEAEVTMLCYFLVSTYLLYEYYSEIPFPNISYVLSTNAIKQILVILVYLILYSIVHYIVYKWDLIPNAFFCLFGLAFITFDLYMACSAESSLGGILVMFLVYLVPSLLVFLLFGYFLEGFSRSYDESNKEEDDQEGLVFIFVTFLFITIPLLFKYYPEIQLLNDVANGFFKLISVITIYAVVVVLFSFIVIISTEFPWLFSLFRVSTVVSPFAFYFYCPNSTVWGLIGFVLLGIGQYAERNESKSQNQTYTYVSCDDDDDDESYSFDDDDDDDESYSSETNDEIYELRREHERLEAERREDQKRRDAERREDQKRREAERREEQKRKEAERREAEKRIVSVAQKGSSIRIYGNRGFLGSINAGNNGVLQGYTSDTVTVRRGRTVYLYNYRGQFIRSHFIS